MVARREARTLVIARPRAGALARLAIWVAIVGGFSVVLLGGAGRGPAADARAHWLLLLVPLFLLPYLLDSVRVLVRGERYVFDGDASMLRTGRGEAVHFRDIRQLELGTVNGGCEELSLVVRLRDGRGIVIATAAASGRIEALSRAAAGVVGVQVVRTA